MSSSSDGEDLSKELSNASISSDNISKALTESSIIVSNKSDDIVSKESSFSSTLSPSMRSSQSCLDTDSESESALKENNTSSRESRTKTLSKESVSKDTLVNKEDFGSFQNINDSESLSSRGTSGFSIKFAESNSGLGNVEKEEFLASRSSSNSSLTTNNSVESRSSVSSRKHRKKDNSPHSSSNDDDMSGVSNEKIALDVKTSKNEKKELDQSVNDKSDTCKGNDSSIDKRNSSGSSSSGSKNTSQMSTLGNSSLGNEFVKEDSILVERGGHFKLVDPDDLTVDYLPMPHSNQKLKQRNRTWFGRGKYHTYTHVQSTYAMPEQQREMKKRRVGIIQMRREEKKERANMEEMERRQAAERSFKRWLSEKAQSRSHPLPKTHAIKHDVTNKKVHSQKAFEAWITEKQHRQKEEKRMEMLRLAEEAQCFVVRDRATCDKAFKDWLRKKNTEKGVQLSSKLHKRRKEADLKQLKVSTDPTTKRSHRLSTGSFNYRMYDSMRF